MHGSVAASRLALTLRRLRSRFGISAPRVAVRTHLPWYWRALVAAAVLGLALALAGWIYDAGRRFAGFDRSASEEEITSLREHVARLEAEASRFRGVANASESSLQIERTALDQLTRQVKALEEENTRLKENLAVFENLTSGHGKGESISLSRLRVEPEGAGGQYRYRLLATQQGAQRGKDFAGSLELHVTLLQVGGDSAMIVFPRPGEPGAEKYVVGFRNFRRLEGTFQVPAQAQIKRVEVRLVQDSAVKASQSVTF